MLFRSWREREKERERDARFRSLGPNPPQQGDIHETWPKPASRQSQGSGGGRGLYSTLEGHVGTGTAPLGAPASRSGPQNQSLNTAPTPRLSRNQMLRERALRLADERSGMSTDEESHGDMLRGRYWSRTERREHLLLAREQRHQQQQARGGGAGKEGGVSMRGGATREGLISEAMKLVVEPCDNKSHGSLW